MFSTIAKVFVTIVLVFGLAACSGGGGGGYNNAAPPSNDVDSQPVPIDVPGPLIGNVTNGDQGQTPRWLCHSPSDILTASNELIVSFFDANNDALFFRTMFSGTPETDVPFDIGIQNLTWAWDGRSMELSDSDNTVVASFLDLEMLSDTVFTARLSNRNLVSAAVDCFSVSPDFRLLNPSDYPAWHTYVQLENAGTQEENESVYACVGPSGEYDHVFGFFPVLKAIYAPFVNGRFTGENRGLRISRTRSSPVVSVFLEEDDTLRTRYVFNNIEFVDDGSFTASLRPAGANESFFFTTCQRFSVTP